jgi:hypothetical protein
MAGHRIRDFALAGAFAAASIAAASSAMAANFDGNWTLIARTTDGHCGVNRFDVAISGGQVQYPGGVFMGFPVGLAGVVTPSGRIQVNVAAGPRLGNAAGRLSRLQGSGKWAGEGPSGTCSGVWTARRAQPQTASAPAGYAAYGSAAASPGFAPQMPTPYWTERYDPRPAWTPYR